MRETLQSRVLPNFFIVGGPRCGTSAVQSYLSAHPNVLLPGPMIEPHYFSPDLCFDYRLDDLEDYLQLFASAREVHVAVGENAGWYLHSEVAVQRIMEFNPLARIVVLLRNPLEIVQSLHAYNVARSIEDERDLEAAWSLQDARMEGRRVPRHAGEPRQLQYRWVGCLGARLERAMAIVPREQLKLVIHDDLRAEPKRVYEELLAFLSLSPDGRTDFPRVNVGERNRSVLVQRLLYRPPRSLRPVWNILKHLFGRRLFGTLDRARALNRTESLPPPLSPACRDELTAAFHEDVGLLSRLVDRDLSGWLTGPSPQPGGTLSSGATEEH